MPKVCLECGTPKFPTKTLNELNYCGFCDRETHAIEGEARRPLCHDCRFFKIHCQDDQWRPALDFGKRYLSQARCTGGSGGIKDAVVERVAPGIVKYDQICRVFQAHHKAPRDDRPNPLGIQARNEIRDYLETPTAFWLDPQRWDHVKDVAQQAFWAPPELKKGSKKALVAGLAAAAVAWSAARRASKRTSMDSDSRDTTV